MLSPGAWGGGGLPLPLLLGGGVGAEFETYEGHVG